MNPCEFGWISGVARSENLIWTLWYYHNIPQSLFTTLTSKHQDINYGFVMYWNQIDNNVNVSPKERLLDLENCQ
jgi:hypothetical protein